MRICQLTNIEFMKILYLLPLPYPHFNENDIIDVNKVTKCTTLDEAKTSYLGPSIAFSTFLVAFSSVLPLSPVSPPSLPSSCAS